MIALNTILLPTDFSEASAVAARYAAALAESFRATLHVLHVIEESQFLYPLISHEGALPPLYDVRDEVDKEVQLRLERMFTEAQRTMLRVKTVVLVGSPFVEIVRYARRENIDLIVLGTHGRGPVAHMLMGSVAERVVRKAPCPVLTVRHPEHEFVLP